MKSRIFGPVQRQFDAARQYSAKLTEWEVTRTSAVQLAKVQEIWRDCVIDVPYYKQMVAAGNAPREIKCWRDFSAIPPLDRATLQSNSHTFKRLSGPPNRYVSTGGSTGQPVSIGEWRREGLPLRIAKLVPWVRLGYRPNSNIYLIWGHAHLLGTGVSRYWNHLMRRTKDWLLGYHRVDAYTLDRDKAVRIAEQIIRLQPFGIIGYSAVLDLLARYTVEYHRAFRDLRVRFVMSCAEPAPRSDTFPLLRSAFGAPILQEFGGVDFGHVAMKTDDDPFLVFPDLNILECDDDESHAQVTCLYRRYTPLIRYRQGDLLKAPEKLRNGHVFQFQELIGRVNDVATMEDGTSVHSVALIHCFKDEDAIFNVQLVLTDSEPCFRLVVRESLPQEAETRCRTKLAQIHGSFANARFEYVTDLATSRAGKRRWFSDERSVQTVL